MSAPLYVSDLMDLVNDYADARAVVRGVEPSAEAGARFREATQQLAHALIAIVYPITVVEA